MLSSEPTLDDTLDVIFSFNALMPSSKTLVLPPPGVCLILSSDPILDLTPLIYFDKLNTK